LFSLVIVYSFFTALLCVFSCRPVVYYIRDFGLLFLFYAQCNPDNNFQLVLNGPFKSTSFVHLSDRVLLENIEVFVYASEG
ncbi:tail fiber domain-containing protein, partial [Escherichia coli]|nr:tail fiber domain-containing protein [Escherichia coli]